MRLAYLFFCVLVVAVGGLFGALNPQVVQIDFYSASVELRLGLALLLAALGGALLGGLSVWGGVVLPLRRRLRRLQRSETVLAGDRLPALADERAA